MFHSPFVHLHVHSYYSLLDGALPIDVLARKAKEYHMPAMAITDHGNMFGAIEFYRRLSETGIKPIIGSELYLVPEGSRKDRDPRRGGEGGLAHLVVLCKNHKGYQNLCHLLTSSYLEGFYYKPRIDKEILKEFNEGLIVLSACAKGEIPRLIREGNLSAAKEVLEWYLKIFSDDRFYLELMDVGIEELKAVNEGLKGLAKESGVGLVATNDVHYLSPNDAEMHDCLLAIQTGTTVAAPNRLKFEGNQFYFRSPDEMLALFKDTPEAISNTIEVAKKCNLELDLKSYHFPRFHAPEGETLGEHLARLAREGLGKRLSYERTSVLEYERTSYEERLNRELKMIEDMGFASYFLIVSDFINWAKSIGIPVGPGRGSAAGSLVAYCLNITDIDPIKYNLLFERFLNPERVSMPDMDVDFCMRRRHEVIEYVAKKYGNVSQIITFGRMKARAVVRDVGRVLGVSYGEVDKIAKLIPLTPNMTLEYALEVEPELAKLVKRDPQVEKLIRIARALEGFPRHASTHAAGIVISDEPLSNFLPLYLGTNDEVVTQYDMKSVEKVGLIKFDFLGLKTLTLIHDTLELIRARRGLDIKIDQIPMSDKPVWKGLTSGDTAGVFQLESSGMTDLIMKLKPNNFEDIIALVALFRPGPLGSGMVEDFINRKHGRTKIEYELPQLEPILKDTYGVIVYQEQVMEIASALAGFSMGESDILRRAMGKKKPEEMTEQRQRFLDGAARNKIPLKKAERIFALMEEFSGYGFNRSHAAAYAMLAYQTAYLKFNFPMEYMSALLTSEMGNPDKILFYINACREREIKVLPPDVNKSAVAFQPHGEKEIRFGLAAVKNVGEASVEAVIEARTAGGDFKSLMDFCERADNRRVNKKVLESLIKCGAFDSLGRPRAQLMAGLERAMDHGAARHRDRSLGQSTMFDLLESPHEEDLPPIEEWPQQQLLSHEKEALGFYITGHPLAEFEKLLSQYSSDTTKAAELPDRAEMRIGAVVAALREINTKKGDRMGFLTLEDLKGTIEVVVFPELYQKSHALLKGGEPILVTGNMDVDEESAKIIGREIFLLREAPERLTKGVHFKLSAPETDEKHLHDLKSILARFPGKCPVYVHLVIPDKSETVMELPAELKVAPSLQLANIVDKVFGHSVTFFQA